MKFKRRLLLERKAMTNLDILKNRDITLLTKVHIIKAMVFPVVMYGWESWIIKKAECQRIVAFELWCWRRLLRIPWIAKRSNQSILEEISPESLEGLMLKLLVKSLSSVRLFVTPWTVAYQIPPSMGFSRQEYCSGLSFPSPEALSNAGIEPSLPHCRQTLYHLSHQGS